MKHASYPYEACLNALPHSFMKHSSFFIVFHSLLHHEVFFTIVQGTLLTKGSLCVGALTPYIKEEGKPYQTLAGIASRLF